MRKVPMKSKMFDGGYGLRVWRRLAVARYGPRSRFDASYLVFDDNALRCTVDGGRPTHINREGRRPQLFSAEAK